MLRAICLVREKTGFSLQEAWLSRLALLMPLLLTARQQLQPDSPESLARRLWEDTEPQRTSAWYGSFMSNK